LNGSESGDVPDFMHVIPINLSVIIFCVFGHINSILNPEQIRQLGWKWLLDRWMAYGTELLYYRSVVIE
jgi:hypothetical protein